MLTLCGFCSTPHKQMANVAIKRRLWLMQVFLRAWTLALNPSRKFPWLSLSSLPHSGIVRMNGNGSKHYSFRRTERDRALELQALLNGGIRILLDNDKENMKKQGFKPRDHRETSGMSRVIAGASGNSNWSKSPPIASQALNSVVLNEPTNGVLRFDHKAPLSRETQWKTTFDLKLVTENQDQSQVTLTTREIIQRPGDPVLLLEDNYMIQGVFPRGFFVVLAQRVTNSFVFDFPDHPWFHDLSGLRKTLYVRLKEENSDEIWELHLKPTRDAKNLFGYIVKHSDLHRIIKEQQAGILSMRRLPLVLDLDDTLVRLVGNDAGRYVPESHLKLCADRVRSLKDGRKVVLTEGVVEFLEWAKNYFDISVCSLGDQNYVDMVTSVLDPNHNMLRGLFYSARQEYEYIVKSHNPRRPSKDLMALYAFCAIKEPGLGSSFSLPLIVDDLVHMWPADQHDNIIVVKEKRGAPVWTVNLLPVVRDVLQHIHSEFFRQLDAYESGRQQEPPSAVAIYKEFLRSGLRDQIANFNN